MVFHSAMFLFIFLPCSVLLYALIPGRKAKAVLLGLLSVLFYSFGGIAQVPALLFCAVWNWLFGLALSREKGPRRLLCAAAVAGDLALLCLYKYTGFLLGIFGTPAPAWVGAAPPGISFFTFHAISYLVDVFRDRTLAEKRPGLLFLYIAFFPRLLAGPILPWRAARSEPFGRAVSAEETAAALRRFTRGLAKKLLLAESAAAVANGVFALTGEALSSSLAWLGAFAYCLQIYYDFSGYSDMAIALGSLFGCTFPENFDHPYASRTLSEFWRRWHMSLNRWFVDYLYIPLGGSREGLAKTVRNTLIVFFFTGLWHGAGWTFILWGLWHGALVSLERLFPKQLTAAESSAPGRALTRVLTLTAVLLGFVMFRSASVRDGFVMIGRLFSFSGGGIPAALALRRILSPERGFFLIAGALFSLPLGGRIRSRLPETAANVLALIGLIVCICAMAGGGFTPFIYQQF